MKSLFIEAYKKDLPMKWDQGLLTVILVIGVTLVGVAACGPSRSEVPLLQRPRSLRTLEACALKMGRHDKRVGGEKQKIEIPVCQVALDGPNKNLGPLLIPVGYTLSSGRRNSMSIQMSVALSYLKPTKDGKAEAASVERIQKTCGEKISRLWKNSSLGADFDLKFVLDSPELDTEHVIYIDGTAESDDGLTMAHWPGRSRFYSGFRRGDARHCVETVASNDREKRRKCEAEAFRQAGADTDLFCQDLAIMTGHYLGLVAEDAKEGRCDVAVTSPSASATPVVSIRAQTFMKAAMNPANRGADFWSKVRFTENDRRAIFAPACDEPSGSVAKN